MLSNTKYLAAIPTAAVCFCAYLGAIDLSERTIYPMKSGGNKMDILGTRTTTDSSWEDKGNPHYQFIKDDEKLISQINIMHDFVSMLLQESQDLDPKYSKVVDKYFWDLV
jgi:hypothetical protein